MQRMEEKENSCIVASASNSAERNKITVGKPVRGVNTLDFSDCDHESKTYNNNMMDVTDSTNDSANSLFNSPSNEGDKTKLLHINKRQEAFFQDEKRLGGSFNIFKDKAPVFKLQDINSPMNGTITPKVVRGKVVENKFEASIPVATNPVDQILPANNNDDSVRAIMAKCMQFKSKAPVGKKIICEEQRMLEYFGEYPPSDCEMNSTKDDSKDDTADALFNSPEKESDKSTFEKIKKRQQAYFDDEERLGGSFNIFQDKAPAFKIQKNDSIDEEVLEEDISIATPKAGGSQGRIGESCSTPKNIQNHTFAQLRTLDVSVIADQSLNMRGKLKKRAGSLLDDDCSKIKSDTFSIPKPSNETFAVPRPRSTRLSIKSTSGSMDNGVIMPQMNLPSVSNVSNNVENNQTYVVSAQGIGDNVGDKSCERTYLVSENQVQSQLINKGGDTFVVSNGNNLAESICNDVTMEDVENTYVVAEPDVRRAPTGVFGKLGKISSSDREKRENSRKAQTSLLDDLGADVASPGRIMFRSRPAKKVRQLPPTPSRDRNIDRQSIDSIEKSIAMSEVTEQPSVTDDDSMADPLTDPRIPTPALVSTPTISKDFEQSTQESRKTRTEIIQDVVNRLYKSPSRQPSQTGSQQNSSQILNRANSLTPKRNPNISNLSVHANFMRPTLCSSKKSNTCVSFQVYNTPMTSNDNSLNKDDSSNSNVAASFHVPLETTQFCDKLVKSGARPRYTDNIIPRENLSKVRLFDSSEAALSSFREANLEKVRERKTVEIREDVQEKTYEGPANNLPNESLEFDESGGGLDLMDNSHSLTPRPLLADSLCTVNTPQIRHASARVIPEFNTEDSTEDLEVLNMDRLSISENDSVIDSDQTLIVFQETCKRKPVQIVLKPREIIKPNEDEDAAGLRRSSRNRMKPVRSWLGEQPVYAFSPGGNRRLVGATSVTISDPVLCKAKTLDVKLITEQQSKHNAKLRRERERRRELALARKARKIRKLKSQHRRGENLDVTVDSIVTSSDSEDES